MEVTKKVTFDEYWSDAQYYEKKPVRNGSRKMLVGDNIYHRAKIGATWQQEDSHHSHPDGTPNRHNIKRDTGSNNVLVSTHFFYFGKEAPTVPKRIFEAMRYKNVRSYRKFTYAQAGLLIEWLFSEHGAMLNLIAGDPFDFSRAAKRYSTLDNKIR